MLIASMGAAIVFLIYFISTPAHTHEQHQPGNAPLHADQTLQHERLYSDLVNSFNSDPESPIVCYRKNHRNFYIIIFFLSFVLLLTTTFFLFRFRRLNALVKRKNTELEFVYGELNSSIEYASNLHNVVLPFAKLNSLIPSSFVLNKSCQKIGGDFFWVSRHDHVFVLAVVDCTGHGVPGALISMSSFDILKRIIHKGNCENPSEILELLNSQFLSLFNPTENQLHAGLDIAMVSVNERDGKVNFAGAGIDLYYTDGESIQEVKGRRSGIGGHESPQKNGFQNIDVTFDPRFSYYLFSDGLPDQFGGRDNKKLGKRGVKELLVSLEIEPIETRLEIVERFILNWQGQNEQIDDMTLIGFKVKGL